MTGKGSLWTEVEYCRFRDLRSIMKSENLDPFEGDYDNKKAYLDENVILTYFTQLTLALEEIHAIGLVHRHMSSEHIFIRP